MVTLAITNITTRAMMMIGQPALVAWLNTKWGASMMMPKGISLWMYDRPRFQLSGMPNTLTMMKPTRNGFHTKLELRIWNSGWPLTGPMTLSR